LFCSYLGGGASSEQVFNPVKEILTLPLSVINELLEFATAVGSI